MTNADVRQTIEWVFKVRDEMTPAVKAIQKTAEEGTAAATVLTDTQDKAASSAEALRATLSRLSAQAGQDTAQTAKGVQEASTALDGLMQRQRELEAEQTALQKVLDESLSMPEPDISKVREAVAEAERLAGVEVVMPAPDTSAVTKGAEDALKEADIASMSIQDVWDELGMRLGAPLPVASPDTSAVDATMAEVEREVSTPQAVQAPDTSAVDSTMQKVRSEVSTPISIQVPDTSAADEAVRKVRAEASTPVAVAVPDTTEADAALEGFREAVTVQQSVPVPETSEAMAAVEQVRAGIVDAGGRIQAEIDLIKAQTEAALGAIGVSADAFYAELETMSQEAADASSQNSVEIQASQAGAQTAVASTNASLDSQRIKMTAQLASIGALKAGVAGVIGGITTLGIVSDETAASLGKVNAAFQIMGGAASMIKAVQGAMSALNVATAINASLNSFNAVLQNPAMLAGVGLAAGAALGVAGAYLVTQNSTSNQTTINIVDGSEGRLQTGTEIYDIVNGGAL